jgi:DNA repair protein RecO (recombination protein O)
LEKWLKMLEKTSGIILHQIKYTDSGIVTQIYTRKFGRQSFLIRGIRNKKAGKHIIHFQPLSVLDLVMYYKESRGMQTIKEFSVAYMPVDIHNNIKKSSIAIFLGEVLNSVLKEESPHEEMFDYIKDSIMYLDNRKERFSNFHIAFLAGLCSYLGFEPGRCENDEKIFFDMINGSFTAVPPIHGNYIGKEDSGILAEFFSSSWDKMDEIVLSGSKRNEILDALLKYYSVHLPGLKKINSLEILKDVFG